ncbi:pentapeptide repeat-containing protein [Acinetobacter seifertii]|uniref:pentapeptide repeat-containing protein n=1 Tax=Acinetobacter seifertii TaxID=1530123 RepID=UPI00168A79DE|nr:pentapeptide repeat-containing protein [Acinetobacter seifertii]QNX87876.1 pentapeptide repeat-containing protein [Acinetobacter seifertii]
MSKLPRFSKKNRKLRNNYSNLLLSKSISSKLSFNNTMFFNVNLRGSRLRKCSFNSTNIFLSDFSGVILNGSKFKNVHFKKCLFYAAIFRKCKFINCKFDQCVFINTNTQEFGESILKNCIETNFYQLKELQRCETSLAEYKSIPILQKNRLLHLKGGSINKATFSILLSKFSEENIFLALSLIFLDDSYRKPKILSTFKLLEEIKIAIDKIQL